MRFYRRWTQFKQQVARTPTAEMTRGPPNNALNEYLAINEIEGPPLL